MSATDKAFFSDKPAKALLLALWLLRVCVIFYFSAPMQFPDSRNEYVPLALNLAAGHGYSTSKAPPYRPTAARVPGYGLFLAASLAPWPQATWVPILLQVLFEGLTIAFLFSVTRRITGNSKSAFIAALLYILWPFNIQLNGNLLRDGLLVHFFTIAVLSLVVAIFKAERKFLFFSGLFSALALAVREDVFVDIALLAAFWIFYFRKRPGFGAQGLLIYLALPLLFMASWATRNYLQFREPIFLTQQSSAYLWVGGNVPVAENSSYNPYTLPLLEANDVTLYLEARRKIKDGFESDGHPEQFREPYRVLEEMRGRYLKAYPLQYGILMIKRMAHYLLSSRIDSLPWEVSSNFNKFCFSLLHAAYYFLGIWGLSRLPQTRFLILLALVPTFGVAYVGQLNGRYEVQIFPLLFLGVGLLYANYLNHGQEAS